MDRWSPRRSTLLSAIVLATVLLGGIPASAGVINVSDVVIGGTPYRAFQDTTTSLTWLDLDNFFDATSTYDSIVTLLAGSGYHLASLTELQALEASIPAVPANYYSEAVIVGGNYSLSPYASGTRQIMFGIYDDGNPADGVSYAWKYGAQTSWNSSADAMTETQTLRSVDTADQDLGAWIVGSGTPPVPEPGTLSLLGLGFATLAVLRRHGRPQ